MQGYYSVDVIIFFISIFSFFVNVRRQHFHRNRDSVRATALPGETGRGQEGGRGRRLHVRGLLELHQRHGPLQLQLSSVRSSNASTLK